MRRLALIGLWPLLLAPPAAAQAADHAAMPGMAMPAATPGPHAGHQAHEGHAMPADPAAPQAQPSQGLPSQALPSQPPPPPAPGDYAADRFYSPAAMAEARRQLQTEHGGGATPYSKLRAKLAEHQTRSGADGYRWDGQAWLGGDIHRLVLKSEGEGTRGEGLERAELQALYSRAIGAYTDLQVGVRQDLEPYGRTYATVGFETLLPYWIDLEGAAFLSARGDLLARVEASYDLRLTNRLILQPRAELNLAAQDRPASRTGSGLSNAELGLRLRYELRREFAPYLGLSWDRKVGKTGDYARARGQKVEATSLVVGISAFF